MFPTPQARPRENGQLAAVPPPELGEHITSAVTKWQPPSGGKLASPKKALTASTSAAPSATPSQPPSITSTGAPRTATARRGVQTAAPSSTPRSIKQSAGWLWQEHEALALIARHYGSSERGRAARSVYMALTQIASQQRTPDKAHTSCQYLGSLALLGEGATRRYLHEFATLGLIEICAGRHQANTFILLATNAGTDSQLRADTMVLADGAGESRAIASEVGTYSRRGIPSGTPNPRVTMPRAVASGTPTGIESGSLAITSDSQIRRKDSKNQETTTTNPAAGVNYGSPDFLAPMSIDNSMLLIAAGEQSTLTAEQEVAATALTGIGVRRSTAQEMATQYHPDDVRGWVRYAIHAGGLKSRAGFVLAMLRAGEAPPHEAMQYHLPRFNPPPVQTEQHQTPSAGSCAIPDGTEGLTEALLDAVTTAQSLVSLPGEETIQHSTSSPQHLAFWAAAREELAQQITGPAWGLWLSQVRLLAVEGATWQLSRPAIGVAVSFEGRYSADIAQVLGTMLGERVKVAFAKGL